jgi:hypothetical protein
MNSKSHKVTALCLEKESDLWCHIQLAGHVHHNFVSEGAVVNKELFTHIWEAINLNLNVSRENWMALQEITTVHCLCSSKSPSIVLRCSGEHLVCFSIWHIQFLFLSADVLLVKVLTVRMLWRKSGFEDWDCRRSHVVMSRKYYEWLPVFWR